MTTVYVGAETQHPRHGIVIVARRIIPVSSATPVTIDLNATTERDTLYRTPHAAGMLKVVAVKGHVLRLAARDGAVLHFNVDKRRF